MQNLELQFHYFIFIDLVSFLKSLPYNFRYDSILAGWTSNANSVKSSLMCSSEVKGVYTIADSKRLSWLLIPMILKACPKNNFASRKSPSNAAKQKPNNKYCAG